MRLLAVLLMSLVLAGSAQARDRHWLITPDEALRAGAPPVSEMEPMSAETEGPGPWVVIKDPKLLEQLRSPVDILLLFEPGASGQPADMNSLTVTLLGLFDFDITDRVRDYISGATLAIKDADLPAGRHRLRIGINDAKGNHSARDLTLTILGDR